MGFILAAVLVFGVGGIFMLAIILDRLETIIGTLDDSPKKEEIKQ